MNPGTENDAFLQEQYPLVNIQKTDGKIIGKWWFYGKIIGKPWENGGFTLW